MKKDEKRIIFNKYHHQGYSTNDSIKIVDELNKYSKGFSKLKKENDKLRIKIKNLKAKIEHLKSKKIVKKNKIGKEVFEKDIYDSELKKNKIYIRRIINHLEKDREYYKTDIKKDIFIPLKSIDFCINYLVKENKIKMISNGTRPKYTII